MLPIFFVFPLFTELFCSFFQFMDLTSLQDTLPDLHTTTDYSGSLAQPWVSQNSALPYIPSGPQGGLSYVAGQDSHMLGSTQQGPFPPRNPFEC